MDAKIHVPNLHLPSTAPKTIIEKETPTYEEPPTQEDGKVPSYLERILSMTTDIKEVTDTENIANGDSNVSKVEYDVDLQSEEEIQEVQTEPVFDHSELMRTPFKWQISKDFGVFEVPNNLFFHSNEEVFSVPQRSSILIFSIFKQFLDLLSGI